MLLSILLQTTALTDSASAAAAASTSANMPGNLWDMATKGGVVMIPIGILFVASLYIAIERYLAIKNAAPKLIPILFLLGVFDFNLLFF